MSSKRVLVVDDSRSARHVLKHQLKKYSIVVDEVESAEDALQYLLYNRPHAIFMDHMMPGMDGLQAVRIIKGNPATGLIPIMMYTSKDGGEVYVGQARALGAVGVLPKEIKSVDLEAVLVSLHLLDSDDAHPAQTAAYDELGPTVAPVAHSANTPGPAIAAPAAHVTERELAAIAREAADDAMVRLIRPHLDAHARRLQASFKAELRAVTENLPTPLGAEEPRRRWPVAAAGLVAGALLTTFAYDRLVEHEPATDQVSQIANTAAPIRAAGKLSLASLPLDSASANAERDSLLQALEWSLNRDGRFAPGEVPFGDARLGFVDELLTHLQSVGFEGVVHLTAHPGSFCMVPDEDGNMQLAPGNLPVSECHDFGLEQERLERRGELESVAFANFVNRTPLLEGSRMRLVVDAAAEPQPRVAYPTIDQALLATDWNAVARENQRIEVRLVP